MEDPVLLLILLASEYQKVPMRFEYKTTNKYAVVILQDITLR